MRHIVLFASQFFARRQSMQDQMLQRLDLLSRNGDVEQLLRLLLRSSQSALLQHVFEEVGHAEDSVGSLLMIASAVLLAYLLVWMLLYLKSSFQRSNIIIVRRSQLSTSFDQRFRSSRVFVASNADDLPTFLEHVAGDRAAEAASCTTNDYSLSHGVQFVVGVLMSEDVCEMVQSFCGCSRWNIIRPSRHATHILEYMYVYHHSVRSRPAPSA